MQNVIVWLLIGYAGVRCLETFWPRSKISGKFEVPYSLPFIVGAYVSVYLAILWEMNDWVASPASFRLEVVGCLMVGVSILGRHWAIRSLGPFHSIYIEIRDHHALVSTGAYQYFRNPYYLSNIFEAMGLPLLACSRSALAISLSVYLPLIVHRVIREDAASSRELGAPFARYKQEVAMIIPTRLIFTKSSVPIATFIEPSAEQTSKP